MDISYSLTQPGSFIFDSSKYPKGWIKQETVNAKKKMILFLNYFNKACALSDYESPPVYFQLQWVPFCNYDF